MQPRISMITLGVKNLQKSIAFYKDGMGLDHLHASSNENVAFFDLNGTWLGLYPIDKLAEDVGIANDGSGFRGVTLAHNLASQAQVDALIEVARAAGAKIVKEPQKVFWGGYSSYFEDLDGHLWEIAHNPFAWIGPDEIKDQA